MIGSLRHALRRAVGSSHEVDELRLLMGEVASQISRLQESPRIEDHKFRVFSQFGEDGIIQHLISRVPVPLHAQRFVEFGVEDYRESNTRFLLMRNRWSGLVLDSGHEHIDFIESSGLRWKFPIDPVQLFITRENLESTLDSYGFSGDIGLISIDVDGNDLWLWESLSATSPRIVVIEYNSTFGPDASVAVPYDASFARRDAHYSQLYYGASLGALNHVAGRKGYRLVGSNSAGNNAFFVREDVANDLGRRSTQEVWRDASFRESRDPAGRLTYLSSRRERLLEIGQMPLVDVETGTPLRVMDLV